MLEINHNELHNVLDISAKMQAPVCIWGAAGIGKSEAVASWCEKNGYQLIDFRLTQIEETDLRGLPTFEGERTVYYSPLPKEGKFCLFLDELAQADKKVLNAASELILGRKCGEDYRMPEEAVIFAAANPPGAAYSTSTLPVHIADRFDHVTLTFDSDVVIDHWRQKYSNTNPVIDYLDYARDAIQQGQQKTGLAVFSTARSWERVIKYADVFGNDVDGISLYAQSAIGAGASALRQFLKSQDALPSLENIMKNPEKEASKNKKVAADVALQVAKSLVARVTNKKSAEAVAVYLANIREDRARAFATLLQGMSDDGSKAANLVIASDAFVAWKGTILTTTHEE